MTESNVIEVGTDGSFDISAPPPQPARAVKPVKSISTSEWVIKKQRGNKAFSEGDFDLAIECYTHSLNAIEVRLHLGWLLDVEKSSRLLLHSLRAPAPHLTLHTRDA